MSDVIFFFDYRIARVAAMVNAHCGNILSPLLKAITTAGNSGAIFVAIAVFLLFFKRTRRLGATALIALLFGVFATNLFLKNVVARPRPFADPASEFYRFWLNAGALSCSGFSFPSGHTTAATAFAVSLLIRCKKRYAAAFLSIPLLMGFTRIYFAVHYASDVLGGFLVGTLCAVGAHFVVKFLLRSTPVGKVLS